jgi:hypothetical protein
VRGLWLDKATENWFWVREEIENNYLYVIFKIYRGGNEGKRLGRDFGEAVSVRVNDEFKAF